MSLDKRLREQLHRDAERIVPDVERNLGAVQVRLRRSSALGWPTVVAMTAAIALAVGLRLGAAPAPVTGASVAPIIGDTPGPSTVGSAGAPFDAIAGTYMVVLSGSDPAVAQHGLVGSWTMRLVADGEIFLSPPPTFGSGTGSLSGLAFTIVADRFRSNIFYNDFCSSIGTYAWSRVGGELTLTPVDDTCAIRRTLLSTAPWRTSR